MPSKPQVQIEKRTNARYIIILGGMPIKVVYPVLHLGRFHLTKFLKRLKDLN